MATDNGAAMAVARVAPAGQLATEAPANPWGNLELLKPHGGLARPIRVEALATISAGYRNQQGYPVVSRDGAIHITDEGQPAPGLRAALAERNNMALTIAVGSDDPSEVLQQSYKRYSKTRLEAHGNHEQITEIRVLPGQDRAKPGAVLETERVTVWRDENPQGYAALAATCKAESFFFFYLARWMDDGSPQMYMPDGWGAYRLRFTSLNSAEAIRNQLAFIAAKTGGRVAGVPLELFITYRNLAGPDGMRRNVPVWTLVLQPPDMLELQTAVGIRGILKAGIAQAEQMALPKPAIETIEQAMLSAPDVDLEAPSAIDGEAREITDDDTRIMRGGGPIGNFERFKTEYFLAAGKSTLRDDEGRHDFLMHWTKGRTGSLREFATLYTSRDGEKLLEAVGQRAIQEIEARNERGEPTPASEPAPVRPGARSYDELFPEDDESKPAAPIRRPQPLTRRTVPNAATQAAVAMSGGPTSVPAATPAEEAVAPEIDEEEQYRIDMLAELERDRAAQEAAR
jgi:hypothetical protein